MSLSEDQQLGELLGVEESLACFECDVDSPPSLAAAIQAGWESLQADFDGLGWNYLGLCPECVIREREQDKPHLTGIRGCCGKTKRKGRLRFCAQLAVVTVNGKGYCYYHTPNNPKKFGERAGLPKETA
jgi:hypothetical protein